MNRSIFRWRKKKLKTGKEGRKQFTEIQFQILGKHLDR